MNDSPTSKERVGQLIDYWTAKAKSHDRWPEGHGSAAEALERIYIDTISVLRDAARPGEIDRLQQLLLDQTKLNTQMWQSGYDHAKREALEPRVLPWVGGDSLPTTLAQFEHRAKLAIETEQRQARPDNWLIAILCDAVRLARENERMAKVGIALPPGAGMAGLEITARCVGFEAYGDTNGLTLEVPSSWALSIGDEWVIRRAVTKPAAPAKCVECNATSADDCYFVEDPPALCAHRPAVETDAPIEPPRCRKCAGWLRPTLMGGLICGSCGESH